MPDLVFDLKTSPAGTSVVGGTLPGSLPSGFVVYYQAWIIDPGAVGGFAATNAVSVTAP